MEEESEVEKNPWMLLQPVKEASEPTEETNKHLGFSSLFHSTSM